MKARTVDGLDPGGSLRPNVAKIVTVRLEELRAFADEALAEDAGMAQHDLRIAAKRLRYLLEIFGPCLGEEAEAARRAAKRLQSILGDLHDCDLMLPRVEHIDSAAATLCRRRGVLFREFVELWKGEASKGTWVTLQSSL